MHHPGSLHTMHVPPDPQAQLPDMLKEAKQALRGCEKELGTLPQPPSKDASHQLTQMLSALAARISADVRVRTIRH